MFVCQCSWMLRRDNNHSELPHCSLFMFLVCVCVCVKSERACVMVLTRVFVRLNVSAGTQRQASVSLMGCAAVCASQLITS